MNYYVREVVLLPKEYAKGNIVSVPRCGSRTELGRAGLIGKIEFHSNMSAEEMCTEVCEVFAVPMGLSVEDIKSKRFFKYDYLQKAGNGSKSLCVPTTKDTFEWSGRQVASLAKSGSFIYLAARKNLLGWVKHEIFISSDNEV